MTARQQSAVSQSFRREGGQKPKRESKGVQVVATGGQSLPRFLKNPVEFALTSIGGEQSRALNPVSRPEGSLLGDSCALGPADQEF